MTSQLLLFLYRRLGLTFLWLMALDGIASAGAAKWVVVVWVVAASAIYAWLMVELSS